MRFEPKQCFGLLGESLPHSFSPLIHAELGSYEYSLFEKTPKELEDFLQHGDFDGLNVTIPYKKSVIPFCEKISDTARSIGSVNTIIRNPDGSLYGDNTDYYGFMYLLKKSGVNPAGEKVLVLGSGGSSLTVHAVLSDMKAGNIVVVSRKGPVDYDKLNEHSDAVLIVNTTPVGQYPANGQSPLPDIGIFRQCRAVIDLVYNPARTELMLQAEEYGIPAAGGLDMLAAQAKKSAEIFTNTSISDDIIDTILKKIKLHTYNIVLIGMPGCGKTSIGKALADVMEREFADTDILISETAGKAVKDILTEDGENTLRHLETEALRKLCKENGLVIATGGGAVTQPRNRHIIMQNGIVVFLDRDIDQLDLSERPLSQKNSITALAAKRLPIYSQWNDFTVQVCGIKETAVDVQKRLMEKFR